MKALYTPELPQFLRDLLSSPPQRGGGLNLWLYTVARHLHAHFPAQEIVNRLKAATEGQSIKHGEIERAVERSAETAWRPDNLGQARTPGQAIQLATPTRRPKWPVLNVEQREAITATGLGVVELWELSPTRLDKNEPQTERFIDALFPGNPLLCVGSSNSKFKTRTREELRGQLATCALIVPSPMTAHTGLTQEGEESEHSLNNTGARRFLIIEQDGGTPDEQAAVLLHLAQYAPLVLAVNSGGKSAHGWFAVKEQSEEQLREFMNYAVSLGADPALWTRSQFTRIPDGVRDNGNRQTVYFFNGEAL